MTSATCFACGARVIPVGDGWVHDQLLKELRVSKGEVEAAKAEAIVNATRAPAQRRYTALHQPKLARRELVMGAGGQVSEAIEPPLFDRLP
jgi:hypothetical protein